MHFLARISEGFPKFVEEDHRGADTYCPKEFPGFSMHGVTAIFECRREKSLNAAEFIETLLL
jgi:hypothetical protein